MPQRFTCLRARDGLTRYASVAIAAPALAAAVVSGLWIWIGPESAPWLGAAVVFVAALAGCRVTHRVVLGQHPNSPMGSRDGDSSASQRGAERAVTSDEVLRDPSMAPPVESEDAGVSLGEQEHFAYNLIDTAQVIVLVLDTQGRVLLINRFMEELAGYRFDEIKGEDWFSTFLPDRDRGRIRRLFLKAVNDIRIGGHVTAILTKDGRERAIEWHSRTLGQFPDFIGHHRKTGA